ncbi:hypothetical protein BDR26DRAFT_20507 [Obelidium mucronatum]|nr:hypothetical protein BDR26DRAFT_20507 [Obelidium mucronatum]
MGLPLEGVVPEPMLCQKFRDWVNRTTNGKYLMIFDAVADMQLLETLFDGVSKFSGHLLLTMKSHEGVTAFSRKCGNGHTLLVPIGHMMEADLEGLFEKKGVTSKGRPIDFSAVNHVLEEAEGDALYSTLVKSYLDMEKCSCEVMVQRMLAVKAKLTKEFGERAASPMSTGDDKAEESKNEEDEDPLLYLLHLIIEALLSHFGALGQAAICILELMTFATTVNPVSSSSLIGGLKLEPDNPVIMNGLKLLHSKCLVRLELQRTGHDNAYRISHPLLHNALLKLATKTPLNQITTHMIQLLHDSATNSKSLLHSLNTVNQFLDSCQYLYQHLSYLPISSSVEGTTVLDPIHDTLLRLAILLFQNNQYREALAALNSLINLLGLKPTINVDKITAIADLAGCLATKCIHNHRVGLSKTKTNPLMALSRRNGAQSLHALASDTLETMVVPHLLNNHPETRDFTTSIQLVRAYLNLASIHGIQTIALLEDASRGFF